jgi:hypothetical protein
MRDSLSQDADARLGWHKSLAKNFDVLQGPRDKRDCETLCARSAVSNDDQGYEALGVRCGMFTFRGGEAIVEGIIENT